MEERNFKYCFETSEEIEFPKNKSREPYIIKDEEGCILEPSYINTQLKRINYLENTLSAISEKQTRETFNSNLVCLSCGSSYRGDRHRPHFCINCKNSGEDLKFKGFLELFKDNHEIKVVNIVGYLYRLQKKEVV